MKSLSYLNKYFFKYKWRFLLGIVFIVVSNYFGVKMPKYVGDATDQLIENTSLKTTSEIVLLALKIGGLYVLYSVLSGFFLFLTRQAIIVMSRLIEFDLKNEIYAHYQRLDYSFYKKKCNRRFNEPNLGRCKPGAHVSWTRNHVFHQPGCAFFLGDFSND